MGGQKSLKIANVICEWPLNKIRIFTKKALCSSTYKILLVVGLIHFIHKQKTTHFVHVERQGIEFQNDF